MKNTSIWLSISLKHLPRKAFMSWILRFSLLSMEKILKINLALQTDSRCVWSAYSWVYKCSGWNCPCRPIISPKKRLVRIAELSEQYASSNLHFTTRQDIQLLCESDGCSCHLGESWKTRVSQPVKLVVIQWEILRHQRYGRYSKGEMYGNVCLWSIQVFHRNPVCQDMGRKIKDKLILLPEDTALHFAWLRGFYPGRAGWPETAK